MKRLGGTFFYGLVFVFSFLLFVYLSFPYAILKEALVSQISMASGYDIKVAKLGPKLPLGFELEGVQVGVEDASQGIDLKSLEASVSLLSLIIGKVSGTVELVSQNDGYMEVDVGFSLLDLITQTFIPRNIELQADGFAIGHISKLGFAVVDQKFPGFGFVTELKGNLHGSIVMELDPENLSQSPGSMNIQLKKSRLALDPGLNLGAQNFEKALIKAKVRSGVVKFDKKSGFHSQLLKIDLGGEIKLKKKIQQSTLSIQVAIQLLKELKDQIGPLLSSVTGSSSGKIQVDIKGILASPKVRTK